MLTAGLKDMLLASRGGLLDADETINPWTKVSPADAFFAYRLLLGRNPGGPGELDAALHGAPTLREFLARLLDSSEFGNTGGFLPAGRLLMTEVEGFRFWFDTGDREMGVPMALGLYEPRSVELVKGLL